MRQGECAVILIALTAVLCSCNEDETRSTGSVTSSNQNSSKALDARDDSTVERARPITEEGAVKIAKEAVKTSPLAGRVPANAKLSVKSTKERFEVSFLRPVVVDNTALNTLGSGYYAMVWVDVKSGEAIVLGEP